jgi:filamentous hemagglutinin family protein
MTVRQTSQKLVADWNTFNIGSQASVTFRQPDATASALNRIHDLDPSQIMGKLTANGQLFLINQSGIIFGKTAQVNVGGVVATSLDMADRDFLEGKYRFSSAGAAGPVINQGVIEAMPGGVVALISPQVENDGVIQADGGSAALLAGDKVSLDFGGDDMINFVIDHGAVQAQASNKGLIQADGGVAVMSARAASELARAAVNNTGIVRARTFANRAGKIVLVSDMKTGTTAVSGMLDASAPNGGDGGFIETSGVTVKIADGTVVTTSAPRGASGTWLIDPNDFTIAASGGDISGSTLGSSLDGGDVKIQSSSGATLGNGDIFELSNLLCGMA